MDEQLPMEGQVVQPWPGPGEVLRDVDNIFERMVRGFYHPATPSPWGQRFAPPVDVEETDSEFIFEFDLPGITRDDITVEVGQNELRIHGEIKERERSGVLRHRTRPTGSFDYRISLPAGVDLDNTTAKYDNGVLTVRVPRGEGSRPRRIPIV